MGSNAPNLRRFKRQELLLRLGGRLGALRATHRIALRPASSSTVIWARNCPLCHHSPRIGCLRLSSALVYLYPREERDSVISTLRCVAFPKAILSQYQLTQSKINASCCKSVSRAWWNGRHARLRIWCRKAWRFKSSRAHHSTSLTGLDDEGSRFHTGTTGFQALNSPGTANWNVLRRSACREIRAGCGKVRKS